MTPPLPSPAVFVPRAFGGVDWIVMAAYGATLLVVGFLYASRQRTTEEFFVAGRNKSPLLAGISIFAALFTLISYLGTPGEWVQHGPVVVCGTVLSIPILYFFVGWVLIPVIMKLPITSAYELLEGRLSRSVRLMGSGTFVGVRLIWMALILHVAATVLVNMIGCDKSWIMVFKVAAGSIATITALTGGIDAVVLVSVIGLFVLLLGASLTVVSITGRLGGIAAWWPHHWESHWIPEPFFSADPHVRVTFVGSCISFLIGQTCLAGSDQISIQRYLTTRDVGTARRAYLNSCVAMGVTFALMAVVGAAVTGFYHFSPGSLPAGLTLAKNGDAGYPYYMSHYLPAGISGLVVAGVLAAAMSGLSSAINSVITVICKDFIDSSPAAALRTERAKVRTARLLALGIGLIALCGSLAVGSVRGDLVEVTAKTVNLLTFPMFGMFCLAIFVRFATPFGAITGAIYSIAAGVLVGYWDVLTGQPRLSFQWMAPVALAVSLAAGCFFSLWPTRGKSKPILAGYAVGALAPLAALIFYLLR